MIYLSFFLLFLLTHCGEDIIPPSLPEFVNANITRVANKMYIQTEKRLISLVNIPDILQSTSYSCGPSSLKAVLRYLHVEIPESEIMEAAGTIPNTGTGPIML